MKIVLYLASGKALLNYENVIYNDLFENRDIVCDMMSVDLFDYDILIATPPCNFYSRANAFRYTSSYSLSTKHLLPDILDKFIASGKPFLVENVRSPKLFRDAGLFDKNCFVYFYGRHTYWTNFPFNPQFIPQFFEFCLKPGKNGSSHCCRLKSYVQGGDNVNKVIDYWLYCLLNKNF